MRFLTCLRMMPAKLSIIAAPPFPGSGGRTGGERGLHSLR